jgi:hypothetical protein
MKKNNIGTLGCLGIVFVALIVTIGGSIVNGYVLSVLWGWFVVPLFQAPQLSIPYAIGISFIIKMLSGERQSNTNNKDKDMTTLISESLSFTFVVPFMILLFGWIVTLFI